MPTRVGGADVFNSNTPDLATYTATSDYNVVGGARNVLVAFAVAQKSAATTTMTMTAEGVSMTQAAFMENTTSTSGYPVGGLFYLVNPAPGLTTIVAAFNGVTERCCIMHVEEWSGVDPADPLGTVVQQQSGAGVDVVRTITPEAAGNIVISAQAQRQSGATFAPDTNVTEAMDTHTGGGVATSDLSAFVGYYTTVGTSSVSAGALVSGGTNSNHIALLVELRASTPLAVTATGGSYTVTGTAAGTLHGYLVDATTAGSYAVTGATAGLSRGLPITATGGSYAVTGTASSLLHGYRVDAVAGSYTVTGTAAGTLHGYLVDATGGSYAVSGTDAGLSRGLPLVAVSGSYTLTGSTAGLIHGYLIDAQAGSYSLTGSDAGLLHGYLVDATSGSYAVTGTAATLTYTQAGSYTLGAGAGSYTVSGTDAGLLYGRLVAADAGSYALTGSDAALTYAAGVVNYTLTADPGSYAITGSDAGLLATYLLAADAGSYEITGSDVGLHHRPSVEDGQSGVSRLRRSRKSWADTHLWDVTEVPALVTDSEPAPELIVAYQEPEPAVTAADVTRKVADVTDEFDPIEIDNDLLMLIAQLAA